MAGIQTLHDVTTDDAALPSSGHWNLIGVIVAPKDIL